MHKVEVGEPKEQKKLTMQDMFSGQFAILAEGQFRGHVVVRGYGNTGFTSLNDPRVWWSSNIAHPLERILEPGEVITITVGK